MPASERALRDAMRRGDEQALKTALVEARRTGECEQALIEQAEQRLQEQGSFWQRARARFGKALKRWRDAYQTNGPLMKLFYLVVFIPYLIIYAIVGTVLIEIAVEGFRYAKKAWQMFSNAIIRCCGIYGLYIVCGLLTTFTIAVVALVVVKKTS